MSTKRKSKAGKSVLVHGTVERVRKPWSIDYGMYTCQMWEGSRFVCACDSREDAKFIVKAVNEYLKRREKVARKEWDR